MHRIRTSLLLSLGTLAAMASLDTVLAFGQLVGGTINGTIVDASNAAVDHAHVVVRNQETGTQRDLSTAADGTFSAPSIPVGDYTVAVDHDGFAPLRQTGVHLAVGQSIALHISLEISKLEQKVTVLDRPPTIDVSTLQAQGFIDERQVNELPLNGRSFDQLIELNPAAISYTNQRSGGVGSSNSSVGNMFSISGRRPQDNLFLLNGIEYTGASLINVTPGGTSGQLLGVEAVREFNVVADTYGANYGKRTGGQISIITASGTNKLHGSTYEFFRNSALDARNYFDQAEIPPFQRNDFGASLGGPIQRDKTFIFGNYEGYRQRLGLSAVTFVPDDASRVAALPSVQPLLALWPRGTKEIGQGIAVAFSNPLQRVREDFGTIRVDRNITVNDLFFAAYTVDDSDATTPSANPYSSIYERLREQVLSAQEQHVFSPFLLNTLRIGYSRATFSFDSIVDGGVRGWVGNGPIGQIVIAGSTASNGVSQITQAGANTGSRNVTTRNLYTVDDHIYWTHGHHQLEAGLWLQRLQSNDGLAQNQLGQASFSTLTDFLQGKVAKYTVVPAPTELGWRSLFTAGFIEDAWKITPRLELRAGFRAEGSNGWNEVQGRASNYGFTNSVINTTPTIGTSALFKNRAKLLPEPRVGIAYDVFGNGKTAVKASVGLHRALLDTLDYRLDQTAPFNTTQAYSNVSVSQLPALSLASSSGGLVSPSNVQPDIETPQVLAWAFKVEQQIAPQTSLTLGYVGSHGEHQILSEDMNTPSYVVCPNPACAANVATGTVYYTSMKFANPSLANTTSWASQGISNYNALEVDVRRQYANGLQVRGVYTFSRNLDNGSAWNTSVSSNTPAYVSVPGVPMVDYGRAATDITHAAAFNGQWDLPIGQGHHVFNTSSPVVQRLATGWTLGGIATLQSGFPFSPQLGYNPSGNGDTRNPIRPQTNAAFSGSPYVRKPGQWFNPAAFRAPAAGTVGNVARDSLEGPGLAEADLSLTKVTRVTEHVRAQFRAELFNALNRSNFNTPNPVVFSSGPTPAKPSTAVVVSPTAGVVTSTSSNSRQLQLALKLLF